jgi:hypothetical protein
VPLAPSPDTPGPAPSPSPKAFYRGSTAAPRIPLRVTGRSAYPSSWGYSTYFLEGSRPADTGTCGKAGGPGAYKPGCAPDWDARANLSISGTVWLQPGQAALPELQLPVDWRRVPYEAEYMVGVRLTPLVNGRAAPQGADAAAAVYGAPFGHCPPGAAVRRGAPAGGRAGDDGPMYGATAALQELHFAVDGLGGGGGGAGNGSADVGAAGGAANGSTSSALDLDPPFQPLTDRYVALLPHTARAAELIIGSTRDGDTVTVDASGCDALVSRDYRVMFKKGGSMWRARYALRAQRRPCWLRVHVFTNQTQGGGGSGGGAGSGSSGSGSGSGGGGRDADADPDALQPQAAAVQDAREERLKQAPKQAPKQAVDEAGVWRVLYRTYTLRFVPLSPPSSLTLRSISFANATATFVACGVPTRLAHLFEPPRSGSAAATAAALAAAAAGGGHGARWPPPAPLVAAPGQQPTVAYYLTAPAAALAAVRRAAQGGAGAAAAALAAAALVPAQPRATQALYTLRDAATNHTVIWSQFTLSECAADRFVLAPLGQILALGPEARMAPELLDKTAQGVRVGTSGTALALSADDDAGGAGGGEGGRPPGGLASLLRGAVVHGAGAGGAARNASAAAAEAAAAGRLGAPRLPGASLELPVITTADDGLSSKTYTLVLYSNITSAATLTGLQPAGNSSLADAGDAAATARSGGAAGSGTRPEEEEEARLQHDAFGARPRAWPASPGQSGNCSLCARGTYSTRLDARECQVRPGRQRTGTGAAGGPAGPAPGHPAAAASTHTPSSASPPSPPPAPRPRAPAPSRCARPGSSAPTPTAPAAASARRAASPTSGAPTPAAPACPARSRTRGARSTATSAPTAAPRLARAPPRATSRSPT